MRTSEKVEEIMTLIAGLTDDERDVFLVFFAERYCIECGREHPKYYRCRCRYDD